MRKIRKVIKFSKGIGYLGYDPKGEIYCWDFGFQIIICKKIFHCNFGLINLRKEEKIAKRIKNERIRRKQTDY